MPTEPKTSALTDNMLRALDRAGAAAAATGAGGLASGIEAGWIAGEFPERQSVAHGAPFALRLPREQ